MLDTDGLKKASWKTAKEIKKATGCESGNDHLLM